MSQSSLPLLYNLVLSLILQPLCVYTAAIKNIIARYLHNGSPVLGCFLDASKAFDLVDHDILFSSNETRIALGNYSFFAFLVNIRQKYACALKSVFV